jgi:hypothetical protein
VAWSRPRPTGPLDGEAETGPSVLKAHLDVLLAAYSGRRVLTGRAPACQRPLARAIIEADRDYVPAVEDNPPELREAIRLRRRGRDGRGDDAGSERGEVVTRRLWCDEAPADSPREAPSFPGLRVLARVDRETRRPDGTATRETRYFAAGLDPTRATLARWGGGHREVENGLQAGGGRRTGKPAVGPGWRPASRPS